MIKDPILDRQTRTYKSRWHPWFVREVERFFPWNQCMSWYLLRMGDEVNFIRMTAWKHASHPSMHGLLRKCISAWDRLSNFPLRIKPGPCLSIRINIWEDYERIKDKMIQKRIRRWISRWHVRRASPALKLVSSSSESVGGTSQVNLNLKCCCLECLSICLCLWCWESCVSKRNSITT